MLSGILDAKLLKHCVRAVLEQLGPILVLSEIPDAKVSKHCVRAVLEQLEPIPVLSGVQEARSLNTACARYLSSLGQGL